MSTSSLVTRISGSSRKSAGRSRDSRPAISLWRPCGGRVVVTRAMPGRTTCVSAGGYQERGILGFHGFMAEYYVESPQWLNKIPKSARGYWRAARTDVGRREGHRSRVSLQRRLRLEAENGSLSLGAGPIGLLAAAVMRARGLDTHVVSREPEHRSSRGTREEAGRDVSLGCEHRTLST